MTVKHEDRPDPSEPWRYTCPNCGTDQIYRLETNARPKGKKYPFTPEGAHQARRDKMAPYTCLGCNERLTELYDRRRDTVITTGRLPQ